MSEVTAAMRKAGARMLDCATSDPEQRALAVYRAMRALEPPAEAQGKWTREAPTEAGWYWLARVTDTDANVLKKTAAPIWMDTIDTPGSGYLRSVCQIQVPPPPTEGSET